MSDPGGGATSETQVISSGQYVPVTLCAVTQDTHPWEVEDKTTAAIKPALKLSPVKKSKGAFDVSGFLCAIEKQRSGSVVECSPSQQATRCSVFRKRPL